MDLLRSQLDTCTQKHTFCSKNSTVVLPTRLLEISAIESGELAVRLAETKSKVGRYVCLSHRWIEGQIITTTTSNIDERRAGIPWTELPKTFREAVTVTHSLGFEYLWIDSLAINQDESSGDWLVEAPKMAQYYQNSSLTISAAEATEGLFYSLADADQVRWEVTPPEHFKQPSYTICVRKPLSHDTSALHHRGWVFQEHMLSPRIAHFGKELIWGCAQLTACECGRFPLPTKRGRTPLHDVFDIGNVISTYGRKQGHMMALSSTRLAKGFCLLPQPVFIRADSKSPGNGLEISHWVLTQKRLGDIDGMIDSLAGNPADIQVMVAESQPQDMDDLSNRPVLLQTGGVVTDDREKETTPQAGSAESGEHRKQDTAESGRATSPESPEDEQEEKEGILISTPQPLAHSRWLDIVAQYSRRNLTFGTDVFPALAGLAKQFHVIFDCDYYAGLWKNTFVIDLLWRSRDPTNHPSLTAWRAPSWSWASTTAAVDYYHLLMALELESHTFRYSVSHFFIDDIQVHCVPLISDDLTLRLRSARVTLVGVLFELALCHVEDRPEEHAAESPGMTVENIEELRSVMKQAICVPRPDIAEDDIRYFPLARCMDNVQELSWLASDTGLDFISKKNKKKEVHHVLDIWWDHKQDVDAQTTEAGKLETFDCLLIARHESTMDTAYFSLLLKPTGEAGTYERVGLLRHEGTINVSSPTMITIV